MASIADLKKKRDALSHDLEFLLSRPNLSTPERQTFETKMAEVEKLEQDIAFEQRRFDFARSINARNSGADMSTAEINTLRQFSFVKFFREATEGTLTGLESEMCQEGILELRSQLNKTNKGFVIPSKVLAVATLNRASTGQNITTAGDGGNLKDQLPLMYREALKNALVLPSLGATYLTGLVGSLPIVRGSLFTTTWVPEGVAVDSNKANLDRVLMNAKRLTATGAFSLELLRQTSLSVENFVRNGLVSANALAILDAVINGLTANYQPVGILNTSGIGSVAGGTDGLTPAWSHLVGLETLVASKNADQGSLAYLTNAKVRGKLKQTLKASNVPGFIWESGEINGYPARCTNAVPSNLVKGGSGANCSAIIFGNWADLLIGDWGGLDIVIDPYTLKKQAEIEISVHTFADIALAHPESFAAMKDALTV